MCAGCVQSRANVGKPLGAGSSIGIAKRLRRFGNRGRAYAILLYGSGSGNVRRCTPPPYTATSKGWPLSKRGGRGRDRGNASRPMRDQARTWILARAHRGCSKASGAALRSDRTVHRYIGDLSRAAERIQQHFGTLRLTAITREQAQAYIDARVNDGLRAATVQGYAKALETLPNIGTLTVPSRSQEAQNQESRAYTADQIRLVQSLLAPAARLATVVMVESGCRVEDLASLCPAEERPLSNARLDQLRPDRFSGREDWPRFTFIGKGGHEYLSSVRPETARSLESIRLETPRDFIHRGLEHSTKQYYALPAGNPLSQQWTRASQRALGYSHGIHGLRHTFAQQRVDELTRSGITWSLALERTSQLMGHYRTEEVLTYLR